MPDLPVTSASLPAAAIDPMRSAPLPRRARFAAVAGRAPLGARLAIGLLVLLLAIALLAPAIAPHDPDTSVADPFMSPSGSYPFGTDDLGRDQLSRMLYGARTSIVVGLATTLAALAVGTALALAATLLGRFVEIVILRACDMLLAFPGLLLALAVVAILGPGLQNALAAVAVSLVPGYVRTVRSLILSVRSQDYVLAAIGLGAGTRWIALRHVLPNIAGGLVVLTTLGTGLVTLEVSSLSFVGLGAQPPAAEWGAMLAVAREYLSQQWWLALAPALGITLLVLAVNVVGDWLQHEIDPRSGS